MNKQQIIDILEKHLPYYSGEFNVVTEEILALQEAAWQPGVLEEEKPKEYRGRLFWPEVSWYEGEPCKHPGCKSHVSHPCEGCGRQWGTMQRTGDEVI